MKFYAREREIEILKNQYQQLKNTSIMTVITGRRRIGKTSLAKLYSEGKKSLYLFVSKKDEVLLCEEFVQEIKQHLMYPFMANLNILKMYLKYY